MILSFTTGYFGSLYNISGQTQDKMINRAEILEEGEETELIDSDTLNYSSEKDTTTINIGRRRITIIDKEGDTSVSVTERDDMDEVPARRKNSFKGNWRGLELGLNNYVDGDFSTSLDPEDDFMELRNSRSRNINLNILQYNFAVSADNIGLVTGLGFEFNNYRFSGNVSIEKEDREIVPIDYDELGVSLEKSRFRAIYLNVPLLLEFQTKHPQHSRRAYFSAGIIGGLNIGSNTKVVYKDNSGKTRERVRDDFYLSPFRYGLTVRTGYRALNLYANYYPTPLFQEGKGPELFPVAVGFSILGF